MNKIINDLLIFLTRISVSMFLILFSLLLFLGWLTDNLSSMEKLLLASFIIVMLIVQIKTKGWTKRYTE